jgi:outer membrane protein assembly factor BamE (lipoprotein component of BamABCDE complex)
MQKIVSTIIILSLLLVSGCKSVANHQSSIRDDKTDRVTVAKVQARINTGMSGAQVVEILGSPNIITTDEKRREVWVYDKFTTETAYSTSEGGVSALIIGIWSDPPILDGGALTGISPSVENKTGAKAVSQRTLTIVIKFDKANFVRDFAYHTSNF